MSVVEGELVSGTSTLDTVEGIKGTEGLFAAIQSRGNVIKQLYCYWWIS
jgi:hypothetical protein